MTANEVAQQTIASLWRENVVYGVVETSLKRPGRGRSAKGSNKQSWRYEERIGELERFSRFVALLIDGLRLGTLSVEVGRQKTEECGYSGFVLIAESRNQMEADFAEYLRSGDNVWIEGRTGPDLLGHQVLHVRCWNDPSHGLIV